MRFNRLAYLAQTCRRFTDRQLEPGILVRLIDCARMAPSSGNRQPFRFVTVESKAELETVTGSLTQPLERAMENGKNAGHPPAYILLFTPGKGGNAMDIDTYVDAGIAAQNIQLAACSEGLATCIYKEFKEEALTRLAGAEEEYIPLLSIAVGHSAEKTCIASSRDGDQIGCFIDSRGIRHIPKRPLHDSILKQFRDPVNPLSYLSFHSMQ